VESCPLANVSPLYKAIIISDKEIGDRSPHYISLRESTKISSNALVFTKKREPMMNPGIENYLSIFETIDQRETMIGCPIERKSSKKKVLKQNPPESIHATPTEAVVSRKRAVQSNIDPDVISPLVEFTLFILSLYLSDHKHYSTK
jgi:hypothetical protein